MFYTYVAGGMLAAEYLAPNYVGYAGLATAGVVMSYYNYIHPFGNGPNPLKHKKGDLSVPAA